MGSDDMSIKKGIIAPVNNITNVLANGIPLDQFNPTENAILLGINRTTNKLMPIEVDENGNIQTTPKTTTGILLDTTTITTNTYIQYTGMKGNAAKIVCHVSALSGTTPSLEIHIYMQDENNTNNVQIAQILNITTIGATSMLLNPNICDKGQLSLLLSGTTPSFTVKIYWSAI